jgi:hypothetical protein
MAEQAAKRRTAHSTSVNNAMDAQRKMDANKDNAKAVKRGMDQRSLESRMKSRGQRRQAGDYKGKYWGPDQFKGDQAKIDAWKKAGKQRNSDGSPKV